MEPSPKKQNWIHIGGAVLILLLACEVVLLIFQNRQLKSALNSMAVMPSIEPLKPGERVEPIDVQTLNGTKARIEYNDPAKKYLLFVLSTTCPHCEKTLPYWDSLAKRIDDKCIVFGLSMHDLDRTKQFATAKNVGFYIASVGGDTSFGRKYKIAGVPETILINGSGAVEQAWVGELTSQKMQEIGALISGTKQSLN